MNTVSGLFAATALANRASPSAEVSPPTPALITLSPESDPNSVCHFPAAAMLSPYATMTAPEDALAYSTEAPSETNATAMTSSAETILFFILSPS